MSFADDPSASPPSGARPWSPPGPEAPALVYDTSALIAFSKHPRGDEIFLAIQNALDLGRIVCVFADVVLEEFYAETGSDSFPNDYRNRVGSSLAFLRPFAAYGDFAAFERAVYSSMDRVIDRIRKLESVVKAISEHKNSRVIPASPHIKAICFDRIRAGLPPDHRRSGSADSIKRSSLNDQAIWQCVLSMSAERAVIFCSDNKHDFADPSNYGFEELHQTLHIETKNSGLHVVDFHDSTGFLHAHLSLNESSGVFELIATIPPHCISCGKTATSFSREPKKFTKPAVEEMQCDACGKQTVTGAVKR